MKHIFLINENAGNGKKLLGLEEKIHECAKKNCIDYEIVRSSESADTENAVKLYSEKYDKVRFYACGGDGTLSVIANYVYGIENAEIAMIPVGSGNDFARSFTNSEYFEDIDRQIKGEAIHIDAISYNGKICVNVLNTGFDSTVVSETERIKKHKFISGQMAYVLGILKCFFYMPTAELCVELDDGSVVSDELQLFVAANASYYGGGFKAASEAMLNDGLMDILMVKKVSRLTFISLISKYKKGTVVKTKVFKKVGTFVRARKITLRSDKEFLLCGDGELNWLKCANIEILRSALKFSVPADCHPINENYFSEKAQNQVLQIN